MSLPASPPTEPPQVFNWADLGRRLPPGCKAVDRRTAFGNPFHISSAMNRDQVCDAFEAWVATQPELIERARRELRGFNLVCHCFPKRCHASTWLRIANA